MMRRYRVLSLMHNRNQDQTVFSNLTLTADDASATCLFLYSKGFLISSVCELSHACHCLSSTLFFILQSHKLVVYRGYKIAERFVFFRCFEHLPVL
ncbi:hypothetical protein CW304_29155 [Bacillus sp. UFRGS-B20]|nr:hypothetical protein CW304_29155 [Bacillus sp. UFRGS-B20]